MFMAMEAPALAERKDMVSGLILQRIFINTVFSGQILVLCKLLSFSLTSYIPYLVHLWINFFSLFTFHAIIFFLSIISLLPFMQ